MMAADTKASMLMNLVCCTLQVLVPVTYCTGLLPMLANEGVNTPVGLKYGMAVHEPVLGVTLICTAEALLQYGPTMVMEGTTGFRTETAMVLTSGQRVGSGVDMVL